MTTQFFPKLSKNYIEILEDDEYYDITIEVGKDPDVKIFRGHMIILCYRSPFLRQALTSNKKNNELTHIKFPDTTPDIFQNILTYIYGGIISLDDQDLPVILDVLVAAAKFQLQELVDFLQKYLIENKPEVMEQQFELTYQTSLLSNSLAELQQFCTDYMAKSPEKIFKSLSLNSLPEKSLITLIKRDDLKMDEVKIWDYVLKWGLARNPTINPEPSNWSADDLNTMKATLQNCFPYVRFFGLSSKDFLRQVRPYRKLLKDNLYEDILEYHLDPEIETPNNILYPRSDDLGSKMIGINVVSLVSSWIDNNTVKNNKREFYLPYEFRLLLRGSRDGFTPKKFHELCDDKPNTVTFIKIKDTDEIIGGYNPSIWKESSGEYGKSTDSFIFSFKSKNNFVDNAILSRVKDPDKALSHHVECGPTFDTDIFIGVEENDSSRDYNFNWCKQQRYKEKIRNTEKLFSIEDYEVFQIIKKNT